MEHEFRNKTYVIADVEPLDVDGVRTVEVGTGIFFLAFLPQFIAVDEAGTEAAAATAIVVGETSAPTPEFSFRADRPFVFFIRDRETGTVLFMGRVTDPS